MGLVPTGLSASSLSACTELPLKDVSVSLDDVRGIVAELTQPQLDQRSVKDIFTNAVVSPLQKALGNAVRCTVGYRWS